MFKYRGLTITGSGNNDDTFIIFGREYQPLKAGTYAITTVKPNLDEWIGIWHQVIYDTSEANSYYIDGAYAPSLSGD